MNGTKSILDRINNLISDDSLVLKEYNDKIDTASQNKNKAEEEKKSYEKDITNIQSDIDEISKVSELTDRFSNVDSYMPGLKKLGKSVALLEDLKKELNKIPEEIESLENKIKELTDESESRSKIIQESDDEISKLNVEISDAKRYQENLIDLIDLAKIGNINKTREEVVETLIHVGFSEKEAVSAAKVILFPEDDLIPYFEKIDTSSKEENLQEQNKKEEVKPIEEQKETPLVEETPNVIQSENFPVLEEVKEETFPILDEEKEESFQNFDENENNVLDNKEEQPFEEVAEIALDSIDETTELKPVEVSSSQVLTGIRKMLNDYGFDPANFNDDDLNAEESLIRENINYILEKNLSKEIVYEYPNIISDASIKEKYEFIKNVLNKTDEDIKLTPEVIASYSKEDLEKLVEVAKQTGINPRIIPLTVYLKGLQPFLRNYLLLKDNNIILDENELSKFAIVLAINPADFRKSLQMLLDYNINLRKNDGKIAIMNLTVKDSELANKMDMIINCGEEDLLKYYPEVLSGDVKGLVNRVLFLRNSNFPYKTQSHNKVIYQSFVLKQEMLDKVLEKHIDLDEVLDKNETNDNLRKLVINEDLIDELDNIDENFDMIISSTYIDDYVEILKLIKGKYKETERSYIIDNYSFSKNKVNRDINYLSSVFADADKESIIIAALLYDSRLSMDDMKNVINILGIKVK